LIRLNIDFGDIKELNKSLIKYSSKLPKENFVMINQLAKGIVKNAKQLAPRFDGRLAAGIKTVKINDKSLRIVSTATNPITGEAYGYIQETGDYSQTPFKKLPLTYAIGNKSKYPSPLITYLRRWAKAKAPQLIKNHVKWITPKGYKPHIEPAFREGIRKVEKLVNEAHERAKIDSNLR
jgi:hypothetical protein